MEMIRTGVNLSSLQDPVAIRNPSPPRGPKKRGKERTLGEGLAGPGVPGTLKGQRPGVRPRRRKAREKGSRGPAAKSPAYSPSADQTNDDQAAGKSHRARRDPGVAVARAPVAAATLARPNPTAQHGGTLPLPAVRPLVPASVSRSHEPQGEDERVFSWSGRALSGGRRRTREKSRGGCGGFRRRRCRFAGAGGVEEAVSSGSRRPERCAPRWRRG